MTSLIDPDDVRTLQIETIAGTSTARLVLRGEADFSTLGDLEDALARVELTGAASVQLDMSQLYFADAATVRRLTVFAREARRTGLEIWTSGANLAVRKVAGLLDAHNDLGLA